MIEQGTPEWLLARAGHATASCFVDVMAKIKSGEAETRRKYRVQLVTERLTGVAASTFQNEAMRWGTEQEPFARMAYEAATGNIVEEVGFIKHPTLEWCGASPDGLVNGDGGVEIKCPHNSRVHVETILDGLLPSEHMAQVQGSLWVTGRQWWDFVSFDPRLPENLQVFRVRVMRSESYIEELAAGVTTFLAEVQTLHDQLKGLNP